MEALTLWADELGVEVVETITELHSGFDLDRDGLYRLLDTIRGEMGEGGVETQILSLERRRQAGDHSPKGVGAGCKIYSLQSGGELELKAGE